MAMIIDYANNMLRSAGSGHRVDQEWYVGFLKRIPEIRKSSTNVAIDADEKFHDEENLRKMKNRQYRKAYRERMTKEQKAAMYLKNAIRKKKYRQQKAQRKKVGQGKLSNDPIEIQGC